MRIAHAAVWTTDVERLAAFYERYFGALIGPRYENPAKGFASRFLCFADGVRLEIMSRAGMADRPADERLGWAHLAFSAGSKDEVDAVTRRLAADGCAVVDGPRRTGDGYYESAVLDPDGNRVEITE